MPTLIASALSTYVTLTPPVESIDINGVSRNITNIYNLSVGIRELIDNGATSLTFGEANIELFLQYLNDLDDTVMTQSQLGIFMGFADTYQCIQAIFDAIFDAVHAGGSNQTYEPIAIAALFLHLSPTQKVHITVTHVNNYSISGLPVSDYLLLTTQQYFSTADLVEILGNSNFTFADRIALISAGRTNSNMDAFTKLVLGDNGTYYLKKSFYDENANGGEYTYYINLTSFVKTLNALPSGVTSVTNVTALTKANYQTIVDAIVTNDERSLQTFLYVAYNQGITIS